MSDSLYSPPGLIEHLSDESKSAGSTNLFWILLALAFALGFHSEAAAQSHQEPLPAYTTGTIYVFEHMKDSVTVPYDGSTTLPDATVYFGVIKNVDGSPAAGAKFSAVMFPRLNSDRPVRVGSEGRLMHADEQGRFRFALKRNLSFYNIFMAGEVAGSSQWTRAQEEFSLEAGQQNVLVSRLRKTFPVRLMLADGTELTSATITGRANLLKQSSSLLGRWRCISLPPDHPYGDAEFRINHTSGTHSFILSNLAIPGTYNAMVDGRVFKPFSVTAADDELILEEDARPFKLRGSVTDPAGKPIAGALVILNNDLGPELREANYDTVKKAWLKSAGRYDELGFYMAETDDNGRYEISGNCAGWFSSLFIFGDGYQAASRNNLFPKDEQTTQATNSIIYAESRSLNRHMFTGSAKISEIALARPAILKIKLPADQFKGQKSFQYLRSSIFDGEPGTFWDLKVIREQDKTVFTVPAGIPFDLVWKGGGTSTTGPASYSISIKTPLKPGEVRDLGDQRWMQEK